MTTGYDALAQLNGDDQGLDLLDAGLHQSS